MPARSIGGSLTLLRLILYFKNKLYAFPLTAPRTPIDNPGTLLEAFQVTQFGVCAPWASIAGENVRICHENPHGVLRTSRRK